MEASVSEPRKTRIVILGGGFGGLYAALELEKVLARRNDLQVTLVDSVAKKVGFLKHGIAGLQLAPRVQARHLTLRGNPSAEGLAPFDAAVSRALSDPPRWAALARPYLRAGGQLVVMAGGGASDDPLPGWTGPEASRYRLPSGDARTLLSYRRAG